MYGSISHRIMLAYLQQKQLQHIDFIYFIPLHQSDRTILPIPGGFHLLWNVLKAVFEAVGPTYITDIARRVGRGPGAVDIQCTAKNFRQSSKFIEQLTQAAIRTIITWMAEEKHGLTPMDMMAKSHTNRPIHNFIYITFYYFVPYVRFQKAMRSGDHATVTRLMPLWLQLFIVLRKTKYAKMTVHWLHSLELLTPKWRKAAEAGTFVRLAEDGLCVGADAMIEYINCRAKAAVPFALRSFDTISKAVLHLNIADDLDSTVRTAFGLPQYIAAEGNQDVLLPVEEKDINDMVVLLSSTLKWTKKSLARDFDQIWTSQGSWFADSKEEDNPQVLNMRRDIAVFINEETALVEEKLMLLLQTSSAGAGAAKATEHESHLAAELAKADQDDQGDADDDDDVLPLHHSDPPLQKDKNKTSSSASARSNFFTNKKSCHLHPYAAADTGSDNITMML